MKYLIAARYGAMGYVGNFSTEVVGLRMNDDVVCRTERGVETAKVVSSSEVLPDDSDPKESGLIGEILRRMTTEDIEKMRHIEEVESIAELKFCQKRVQERGLPMKLASVEHLFGGTKIIFYFLADGRVDFRELVKDLAQEYHCRIELRQIGVRDEARLLADYEHCGRPLCCRTFVKKLEPVTMKMAKSQKATLDPTKISGRCGRLMCCLRFEDATYEECKRQLPSKGARVVTSEGKGVVVDRDILRQLVKVENAEGQTQLLPASEVRRDDSSRRRSKNDDSKPDPGSDDGAGRKPKNNRRSDRKKQDRSSGN